MNFDAIRQAIVDRVNTAWQAQYPATVMVFDNTPYDPNATGETYLKCEIKFLKARQMSLGPDSPSRIYGYIYFTAATKVGQGTRAGLEMLGFLAAHMKRVRFGGVQTETPALTGAETHRGWFSEELKVTFLCDIN